MKKINKLKFIVIILFILINNIALAKYRFKYVLDVAEIVIDNNPPNINIQYVGNESNEIKVIIISDEKIKKIEGWNFINDYIQEKVFYENTDFNIDIEDLYDNVRTINILINTL